MLLALLVVPVGALVAHSAPRARAVSSFAPRHATVAATARHRAKDVLGTGESVSTKDIINVLGRWTSYTQWESVGELPAMDKLFDESGRERNRLKAQQSSGLLAAKPGNGDWVKKTPQRRGWCIRNGLVQRYWFTENVGLLPYRSKALAASVGCTVAELADEPISPLAADIVFDALAHGNSGIMQREVCDERRASWEGAGGFDAAAFDADLGAAKTNIVRSYCLFPGSIYVLQARRRTGAKPSSPSPRAISSRRPHESLAPARAAQIGLFLKLDGLGQADAYLAKSQAALGDNFAMWAGAFGVGS